MANINQRQGRYLVITRRMRDFFKEIPELLAWLEAVTKKVDGSAATLSDVEQRSGIPALSRVHELDKYIAGLVKSAVTPLKGRVMELEKEVAALRKHDRPKTQAMEATKSIADLQKQARPRVNLHTVERQIADIEKTYRPR
jgi:hypothetical protein